MIGIFARIAAATALGAAFEFSSPDFWIQTYSIPPAYCETQVVIADDPLRIERSVSPCRFDPDDRPGLMGYAYCRPRRQEMEETLASLRRDSTILSEHRKCDLPPEYPELYYKRDELRAELTRLPASTAPVRGILGLVDAQLLTLDGLIDRHELAQRPLLEVAVIAGTQTVSLPDAQKAAGNARSTDYQRERPQRASWEHHWARRTLPVCDQLPLIFVSYESTPGSTQEVKIKKSLNRLGAPFTEAECTLSNGFMILSKLDNSALSGRLARIEGLQSLRASQRMRYNKDMRDDERYAILSEELRNGMGILAPTPHILALAEGELKRIKKAADRLKPIINETLVIIQLHPKN